jgi:hypothetical protein
MYEWLSTGVWVVGFIDHLRIVTTCTFNIDTPNITVTTAPLKFSQLFLVTYFNTVAYVLTVWHIVRHRQPQKNKNVSNSSCIVACWCGEVFDCERYPGSVYKLQDFKFIWNKTLPFHSTLQKPIKIK